MVDGTGYEELYTYNTADGSLCSMKVNGEDLIFSYNALKQLSKRTSPKLDVEYAYGTTGDGFTTNQVTAIRYRKHGETTYRLPRLDYTYDEIGNIKIVTPLDKATVTYEYDTQNKLRKETKGTTVEGIYDIDTYGNIRSKQWKDSEGIRNYTFTYGTGGNNDAWMDQIKTVPFDNGSGTPVTKTLSYDVLGNPTKYYNGVGEWDFTWRYGRQLATAKKTGTNITITNTYDVDGIRDSKTVGSVKHTYTTLSGKIIREKYGTTTIDYLYDNEGRSYKLILDLNGTKIHGYFALNLQGDVIAIIDSTGEVAVTYEYDAWGREIASSTAGDYGSRLYAENRLKYRGYYYDSETGFYYLNSRYYDPEIGRFLSADNIELVLSSQSTLSDKNLYAYCDNNPVMRMDADGELWITALVVGAGLGVLTQAVADVGIGLLSGNSIGEIVKGLSPVDYVSVAISGALAATGFSAMGSIVANATLGGVTYLANCNYRGVEANTKDLVVSTAIGGGSGANGEKMRGVYRRSKQVINSTKSATKSVMYTAKITAIKKNLAESSVRTFVAGIVSNVSNLLRKRFTGSFT